MRWGKDYFEIVSSCVCVIIPNLTRNVRPYAFFEPDAVKTYAERFAEMQTDEVYPPQEMQIADRPMMTI